MEPELIALLTLVCALTYSFEITFGLAGTILMLTVMHFFADSRTLVIYSCLPQIMVASIGLYRSPRTVDIRFLGGMLIFALAGALVGLYLFYQLPEYVFRLVLATAITASGIWLVANPATGILSPPLARAMDVAAGMAQTLVGISGPLAMTRLLGTFDSKVVVRNYAFGFFLSMNLVRVAGYALNGTFTREIGWMMLWSAPVLALVLWYTSQLHHHFGDSVFRRVVSWVILLGGLTLYIH